LTRQQIAAGYGPGQCAEAAEAISKAYPEDQVVVIQTDYSGPLLEPPGIELGGEDIVQHVVTVDPDGNVWDNFSDSGHHGSVEDYLNTIRAAQPKPPRVKWFPSYEAARKYIDDFWSIWW